MYKLFLNIIGIYISHNKYVLDADYNTALIVGGTILVCTALVAVVSFVMVIVLFVSVRRFRAGMDDLKGQGIKQS